MAIVFAVIGSPKRRLAFTRSFAQKLVVDQSKVECGYGRILVRDDVNAGWINYMLKDRQKSEFDGFVDCIIIESLHNPIVDA